MTGSGRARLHLCFGRASIHAAPSVHSLHASSIELHVCLLLSRTVYHRYALGTIRLRRTDTPNKALCSIASQIIVLVEFSTRFRPAIIIIIVHYFNKFASSVVRSLCTSLTASTPASSS